MMRFRLGPVPVQVSPSHFLLAAFLAWSWMPAAHSADSGRTMFAIIAGGLVVFVSILVHEMGHATFALVFGYKPAITIQGFGGYTQPNAHEQIPWWKDILLTLAGPGFGLLLAVAAGAVLLATGGRVALGDPAIDAPLLIQTLQFALVANLFWAVVNLIPVLPMDGGRVSNALFVRAFGPRGALGSYGLSLVICVAVVAWGATRNPPAIILILFFGMWGFQALQVVSMLMKGGGARTTGAPHPSDLAFAQAAALFGQEKYGEARTIAERALLAGASLPQPSRSRLHHLLGWISVKEGDGQAALQHFGQVGGDVEPHALASAFALSGDDARALTLWELAYRTTQDPTVRAEWAGTLIRLGRVEDARQVAHGAMPDAWRAAEGTLVQRGDFAAAAEVGLRALAELPSPELAYDTACSLAKAGRTAEAQQLLDRAVTLGFKDASHAEHDPDLAALRHTPEFTAWLSRLRQSTAS